MIVRSVRLNEGGVGGRCSLFVKGWKAPRRRQSQITNKTREGHGYSALCGLKRSDLGAAGMECSRPGLDPP